MKYEKLELGKFYHIFNQGNNKEDIFIEDFNYDYFLKLMKKYILPVADVFSYCLLKNHFHWLVRIKEEQEEKHISKMFSNFFNSYSKSINKKYQRSGSLFRDRFKRICVNNEDYLKKLIVYINLNPIHHQFVKSIEMYKYSSYLALISEQETVLERVEVINLFGGKENFMFYMNEKKLELNEELLQFVLE